MSNVKNATVRRNRVRSKIAGTTVRPRLSVYISNKNVIAQIVDDEKGETLAYSSSLNLKSKGSLSQKAEAVGTDVAKKASAKKIKQVVFDRNVRQYHGRVKSLAEAARKEGLEF